MNLVSRVEVFDTIALTYDDTIDWKSRLEREMPFLKESLGGILGKRILDLACGTGRHSIEFAADGASVVGIDISQMMLNRARNLAQERGVEPEFIEGDMSNIAKMVHGKFDMIFCLGNSLSLIGTHAEVLSLLQTIHSILADDGVFVGQVLNFNEIRATGFRFFPLKNGITDAGDLVLFMRFFDHGPNGTSELFFVTSVLADGSWRIQTSVQTILNMDEQILQKMLSDAGFGHSEVFADYGKAPFRSTDSRNLLVRARK